MRDCCIGCCVLDEGVRFAGPSALRDSAWRWFEKDKEYCLADIKEALRAAAPARKNADRPRNFAQRVVTGARNLSPFLGERMLAGKFISRLVAIRN